MKYQFIFSLIIIIGCNFPDNEPVPPLAFEAIDSAKIKSLQRADSIERQEKERLKSLVSVIKIDKETKCNLTNGYYALNNSNIDTTDLKLLAKFLASQLLQSTKKQPDCDYHVMSAVFIYAKAEDYDDYKGNYIAMCDKTPSNHYDGEVFINALTLRYIKSQAK